jgi:hypothetical protein
MPGTERDIAFSQLAVKGLGVMTSTEVSQVFIKSYYSDQSKSNFINSISSLRSSEDTDGVESINLLTFS